MLRSIALPFALLSITVAGLAFAAGASPQDDDASAPKAASDDKKLTDEERQERLHDAMHRVQSNFKRLRKVMRKPEMKAEAMDACAEMEAALLESLHYVPAPEKALEGGELLAHQIGYKRRMAAVYTAVLDMQMALEEGDADKVKELYKSLGKQKKDGHDLYIPQGK